MTKHILLLGLTVLSMTACHQTENRTIADSAPIMPIHCQSDTTHLYLTDYVPQLTGKEALTLVAENDYQILPCQTGEIFLVGNNALSILRIQQPETPEVDIPVLPRLEMHPGLITHACTDATVTIGNTTTDTILQLYAFIQNRLISEENILRQADGTVTISIPSTPAGRTFLRVYATGKGFLFNDLLVPLQDGHPVIYACELNRQDDQAQVLYSLLVDRFNNGDPSNDQKLHQSDVLDIVDYQGGDLRGIQKKIEEGFFDTLGVSTLWISPITQNPYDAWGRYPFMNGNKYNPNATYTRFSGYHGYWPIFATKLDDRFGQPDDLKALLATAHAHNMNVILDYVANHMHINSPTLQQHPDWHTDSILPDGRRNFELWDEARLTTWFDVHIPTLDLERPEVTEAMTDSALYWLANYDLDGFRHDACKHIPECYWRTLTHKAVTRFPNRHIWMIGETYGSPELINTYVKTGMLNAQFDFNVYFTAIHALTFDGKMSDVERTVLTSLATYGAHHTMGNISGNHDQARFASLAGGAIRFDEDAKEAGWTREVGIGDAEKAYRTALLLEMLNLTIPGVPCIYQGDEYAEVGGNDPDNRHLMRFEGLNPQEKAFRHQVSKMIHLRRTLMPLMYGEFIPVASDDDTIEFLRVYMGDCVQVKISRTEKSYIKLNNETLVEIN